jgi:serine protease Do
MARRVMEQLVATGKVSRGRVGVVVEDLGAREQATNAPNQGAVIAAVVPRSAAARAGIHGDLSASIPVEPNCPPHHRAARRRGGQLGHAGGQF